MIRIYSRLRHHFFRLLAHQRIGIDTPGIFQDIGSGSICIDCGANVGLVTRRLRQTGAEVYAFEPHPAAAKELQQKFAGDPKVKIFPNAVGTENGMVRLYFHKDSAEEEAQSGAFSTSASLMANKSNINKTNYVDVECVRLSEFIKELPKTVDFLKVDIEGLEIDLVWDLIHSGAYKRIRRAYVETHESKIPGMLLRYWYLRANLSLRGIKVFNFDWN